MQAAKQPEPQPEPHAAAPPEEPDLQFRIAFKRRVLKMMPELEVAARAGLVEMTETWVTQMKSGRFTGYRPGRSQVRQLRRLRALRRPTTILRERRRRRIQR